MLRALVAAALVCTAYAAIAADQITALPGWNQALPSAQYSGYLNVGAKYLHYWFVEALSNPSTAPVVLWLNGGPGCSSLEGYLYEQGPFHNNPSNPQELYFNNYTWAGVANMIYLEAPAGVGFSYSTDPADYHTNDLQTAEDNYAALQAFFAGFPEYADNDFFIAGESYAGVYVPTLAYQIYLGTQAGTNTINLKGIMVGNGCTGDEVGICGSETVSTAIHVNYYYTHALISPTAYSKIILECNNFLTLQIPACETALQEAYAKIGNVDIYNIYGECINGAIENVRCIG